jgi:general secretion pathway protein E
MGLAVRDAATRQSLVDRALVSCLAPLGVGAMPLIGWIGSSNFAWQHDVGMTLTLTHPIAVSDTESVSEAAAFNSVTALDYCTTDKRLSADKCLALMMADGLIGADEAKRVSEYVKLGSVGQHAFVAIASRKPKRLAPPQNVLEVNDLCKWLCARISVPYLHIDPLRVDFGKVSDVMSSQYASRFKILPVESRLAEVVIATAEPFADDWVGELGPLLKRDIKKVVANPADINRYIVEFFSVAKSIKDANKNSSKSNNVNNFEQLVELGKTGKNVDANDQHVVQIVDWLWQYAFEQRASDIHLEPRREQGVVRFRIDGVLHNVYQVPSSVLSAMTARIKLLGRMDVVEKRRPQDGRIKTRTLDGKEIELRLSTLPVAFGEKLVMRIFDPDVLVKDFSALGFSEDDLNIWNTMTSKPNGIVLVTGPTGSGKTTTLYTTLKQLATEEVNVSTVEDPIEMVEPSFNQMQVQSGIDLNFADGVRALMRQDPDIIMIGEIRDLETANMAIQAALTGHLVLSTLHTNDSPAAITRMLDLGVPAYLIASTVIGVMAQRLVRTLCSSCKEEGFEMSDAAWDGLIAPFRSKKPARLYKPVGCLDCRMTGYRGRSGLYEMLVMNEELRNLIKDDMDLQAFKEAALRTGMKPLRLAGAQKIIQGASTLEEVLKSAPLN